MRRLICPYPPNRKVDRVLKQLGEDFGHYDDIHNADNTQEAESESDANDGELADNCEDDASEDAEEVDTAVAGDGNLSIVEVQQRIQDASSQSGEPTQLSVGQAERVHAIRSTIGALQGTIEGLKNQGVLRGVQAMEWELKKVKRRERALLREEPAVAETFVRLRKAEEAAFQERQLIAAQMKQRNKDAAAAIAAHKAAVAELNKTKRKLQELESARQCKHAVKTFTLVALGEGSPNAGGAKARKNRHEVLDRLSRLNTGLSDEQKNDFAWWKDAWDEAMVKLHGANWAATFAGWVTNILDSTDPTAFTNFVYNETVRVLSASTALVVPGA